MPTENEPTLRDRLAVRRTQLANERTLLAYARTALMLVASGATLWRIGADSSADRTLGALAVGAGIAALAVGCWRFTRVRDGITR